MIRSNHGKLSSVCAAVLVLASAAGLLTCRTPSPGPAAVRLVDRFSSATVEGGLDGGIEALRRTEWQFSESEGDWQIGQGVKDLRLGEGRLIGTATSDSPLLHVERTTGLDADDLLHAVEIRARVSGGGQLSIRFSGSEELDLRQINVDPFPWPLSTPTVAEEERLYTLTSSRPILSSAIRHVVVRPTDETGASFEISSLRLVFRREHLRSVAAGIGWHGMSNIYRETVVSRSPEIVRFAVTLPPQPWMDLAVATIEKGAATFEVEIASRGSAGEPHRVTRTVTTPDRWQPFALDLSEWSGQEVTLSLALQAPEDGFLGFWGTPVVRSRRPSALASGGGQSTPQGVIVVVADTLRSDHLQTYGYKRETAPSLGRLAAAGVMAKDCISQATWTKVSMPSIFTSLYPSSHTVHEFTDRLPASATTLAEVFRQAGYATLGLTSISFAGQFTNLHQGYEELHEQGSLQNSSAAKTAREYVDRLLPWLDEHREVPFFVFLHVADPHSPYTPYEPYDTLYGEPGDQEEYLRQQQKVRPLIENPVMRRFGMPTRQDLEKAELDPEEYVGYERDAYDGSIRGMDVEIGRLLERLDELGLADRTLIAFTSDHGTELLEHDEHFHGHTAYGELSRVPLFFRGPGVPAGVTIPQTVRTIDLMPTVLELAGLEAPAGVQGQSLVPLFHAAGGEGSDGSPGAVRFRQQPAVTEKARFENPRRLPGRQYESIAMVLDGWRLIHNAPAIDGVSEYELYDHRKDPLNLEDLAAENPERVQQMAEKIEEWRKYVLAGRLKSDDEAAQDLSAAELDRLRSLGYL